MTHEKMELNKYFIYNQCKKQYQYRLPLDTLLSGNSSQIERYCISLLRLLHYSLKRMILTLPSCSSNDMKSLSFPTSNINPLSAYVLNLSDIMLALEGRKRSRSRTTTPLPLNRNPFVTAPSSLSLQN